MKTLLHFADSTRKVFLLGMLVLCTMPLTTHAAVRDELKVRDDEVVSRGDFIRAAIKLLNVEVDRRERNDLPYLRVPRDMMPYIAAAHRESALQHVFGKDLNLSRGITRGQALQILVGLEDLQGGGSTSFRDVTRGTNMDKAVRAAVELGWMDPLQSNYFGVDRLLVGREGLSLLQRVVSDGSTIDSLERSVQSNDIPTIKIRLGSATTRTSTLPKSEILEAVWNIINAEFLYNEKIDLEKAAYAAAEAIVKSLDDPYSTFLKPSSARNFQTQIDGQVSGIGAQVEDRDGILTVVTPLRGSPAEKAGLLPNDQIVAVDGVSIHGIGLTDAVEKIRGKEGSSVKITIRRDGVESTLTVIRATIKVPEIEIDWQGDIAIVRLLQFGRLTESDLRGELAKVQAQDPHGIVLDLRNNPGGLLHAASVVLSSFLPQNSTVAQIQSRENDRIDYTELPPVINANVPVIVLVNAGSASASEIVAGSLQDAKRATIVGEQSFGKGTVQEVLQFHDGSSIKLTIAEWLTPQGRHIEHVGVTPDVIVKYSADRDEQLLKALELLR